MTISANLNDKIAGCIIESTAVPGQPAVAVVNPDGSSVGGGGAVSSVFSRTGAVVAASGDYTVGQVTGAAPLAGLTATITGTTAGALYTSYKVSSGTFVFTLPVPVSGGWTTVTNCGSGVVTIAHNSTEVIFGLGLGSSGASSIALGAIGATVTLESDGTNWQITAGQQDTGWISFTPTSPYTALLNTYYRKMGNIVKLKGEVQAGSSVPSPFWTPPAGFAPGGFPGFQITGAGVTASSFYGPPWNIYNPSSGDAYFIEAIQYTVD
jgi:hypothetical protein